MSQLEWHPRYCGSLVSITDVRCRPSTLCLSGEEHDTAHKVVFPRAGVFVKHVGRQQIVGDPNHVLFFTANEPYRVKHPVPAGDECTSFAFETEALIDALCLYDPKTRDQPASPFPFTHLTVGPRIILQQQQLRRQLKNPSTDDLEIEESALKLLYEIVRGTSRLRGRPPRHYRSDTLRLHREWVQSVKLLLGNRPEAKLTLAEIARTVHCSPFHLARLFRDAVGISIHSYQLRLRLALSLERLTDQPTSLTEVALDLGFSSHSHFSAAFQRNFGLSPSSFRQTATGSLLRKMSKILKV